ncbi:MAG: hypothetical protein EOM20_06780 [Spartobacteria bacterium]|nr:hypothetical protein [Spartobacteria bacterium]
MSKIIMLIRSMICLVGRNQLLTAANIAEGDHADGAKSFYADAAITEKFGLVKIGTDVNHIAACGNDEVADGIVLSELTATEITDGLPVAVKLLGAAPGTVLMVASEAIDPTSVDFVCTAASGRVKALPAGSGTYYIVGKPITAASVAGDVIEVIPCVPTQRVVE